MFNFFFLGVMVTEIFNFKRRKNLIINYEVSSLIRPLQSSISYRDKQNNVKRLATIFVTQIYLKSNTILYNLLSTKIKILNLCSTVLYFTLKRSNLQILTYLCNQVPQNSKIQNHPLDNGLNSIFVGWCKQIFQNYLVQQQFGFKSHFGQIVHTYLHSVSWGRVVVSESSTGMALTKELTGDVCGSTG